VDANGAWSPEQAVEKLDELAPLDIELAEQPAPTLADLAAVRRRSSVRIAADESVEDAGDAQAAAELDACDAATVKLAKVGGIAAARAVAAALPVYMSSALDGPVGIAAAAHVAQALPDSGFAHGLATARLFSERVAMMECELRGAALAPSNAPGLGVVIDEGALERLAL
jgi:O-succinylbenzoate synthase